MSGSRQDEELAALRCIFADFSFEKAHGGGESATMSREGRRINVHLPLAYPDAAAPAVTVTAWPGLSRTALDAACRSIASYVERQWDETRCECLFAGIEHAMATCDAAAEAAAATASAAAAASSRPSRVTAPRPALAWLWFHHIKSSRKKDLIKEWAAELALWALCKPGWPGVIYCEGDEAGVSEFIKRLKGLQWQAFVVRDVQVLSHAEAGAPHPPAGSTVHVLSAATAAAGGEADAAAAAPPLAGSATGAAVVAAATTVPLATLGVLREPGALLLGEGDMHELSALCKRMGREGEFMAHIMRLATAPPAGTAAAATAGSAGVEARGGGVAAGKSAR